jgi:hypothetical protein
VITIVSLTILVVAGTLDCAFVKVLAVPVAFASALPLNMATAIVRNMPASRVVLPTLSLLIVVLVFMMFSFGFGWWFVLRLLMSSLYRHIFLSQTASDELQEQWREMRWGAMIRICFPANLACRE